MAKAGRRSSAPVTAQKEKNDSKKKKSDGEGGGAAAAGSEEKQRRPSRERKQVERYFEPYPQRSPAAKNLTIEQGPGKKLRDIPNVLIKLSKRKIDDTINVLHTILFGRKAHVNFLKRNILQFSGFVWAENEERQKAKVKEKFDKCTKDKLLDFCQLFDLPINKAITKKEEASTMLLEFLQSPYVSRDVVLAEKEHGSKKRKRTKEVTKARSGEAAASDKEENKKQKRSSKSNVIRGREESSKVNEDDKHGNDSGDIQETDNMKGKPISRKKSSEKQTVVGATKLKAKTSSSKKGCSDNKSTSKSALKIRAASPDESNVRARSKNVSFNKPTRKGSKATFKEEAPLSGKGRNGSMSLVKGKVSLSGQDSVKVSKRKESASVNDSASAPPTSKLRKADTKKCYSDDKPSSQDKKAIKGKTAKPNLSSKEIGKRKVQRKAIKGPSRETMLPVVADLLKEIDFEVVTLADFLRKLESHFKVSLSDRKTEVKDIIKEVMLAMSDPDEAEEDEGAENNEDTNDNTETDEEGTEEKEQEEDQEEGSDEEDQEGSDDGDGDGDGDNQ